MDKRISLIESIKLRLNKCLYIGEKETPNLNYYIFKCPKHGLVESYPHGYYGRLECPFCYEDMLKELEKKKKEKIEV